LQPIYWITAFEYHLSDASDMSATVSDAYSCTLSRIVLNETKVYFYHLRLQSTSAEPGKSNLSSNFSSSISLHLKLVSFLTFLTCGRKKLFWTLDIILADLFSDICLMSAFCS